jgi:HK97 family phage portal protein
MELVSLQLVAPEPKPELRSGTPFDNPANSVADSIDAMLTMLSGGETASGETISEFSAMQITTVMSCISIIAKSIASLPLYVFESLPRGRRKAVENALYDLLAVEPNPEMTAMAFWEAIMINLLLTGNGYAEIRTNAFGNQSLWPLLSTITKPVRLENGELAFETLIDGRTPRIILAEDMLHIPALALDGIVGMNVIHQNRQSLGIASASEKAAARIYANGVMSTGVLTVPEGVDAKQKEAFRDSLSKATSGAQQHRPLVVTADIKWVPLSITPTDAQFLESRKYSREVICSMWGVPPHMVGILERSTNNNIEHQGLEFLTQTLKPYLVRIEQEVQRKLMPKLGRSAGKYYVQFDVSEFFRGDLVATSNYYKSLQTIGVYSINETRDKLGYNPIDEDGGDLHLVASTMLPITAMVGRTISAIAPPQPSEPEPDDEPVKKPGTKAGKQKPPVPA